MAECDKSKEQRAMKVHKARHSVNAFTGARRTTSLCGRLNNACDDGMNITEIDAEVTCGFCVKKLARIAFAEVGRRNAEAALAKEFE